MFDAASAFSSVEQRRVEALERQRHQRVLERIGEPPDPVVVFDEQVFLLDRRAVQFPSAARSGRGLS
jgi:hypothetical protein